MRRTILTAVAVASYLLAVAPEVARADTYTQADFSGQINPGNANVQAPFAGNGFTQGESFSGSFVFDDQLVPGTSSGFTNVPFSSFPDSADIPAISSLSFTFGTLSFNLSNDLTGLTPAAIQYDNGQFNGLVFISDFTFQNTAYQFFVDGSAITVTQLNSSGNPVGSSLINAELNIGNASLTNETPFTPTAPTPVPLPGSLGLLGAALAAFGSLRRRRSAPACAAVAC
jgi:hypothetical protein